MVDFAKKLKLLRTDKHITQAQLAERLWITKSMVSAYETSMRMPSYDVLVKIAKYFNVTTDYLLGLEKKQTTNTLTITQEQHEALTRLLDTFSKSE